MRYAGQPLNRPLDANAPAIKRALCGLLWEEIRPLERLELTWAASAERRPAPDELAITTLDNQGTASSWWNNLGAVKKPLKPAVSADGKTYVYDLKTPTCGVVISVAGGKLATDYDVPMVRALVAATWKKMDIEVQWGFDAATADKDYSGRIETYDGHVAGLHPLDGDRQTVVADASSWRSIGKGSTCRGVKLGLLYMGISQRRRVQPFTTQADDVPRTIVTLWTKAGNFSFLAADLESGPILAPEYGFFVRRVSPDPQAATARQFVKGLRSGTPMLTIRQQIRAHEEQTWEGAVTAMCGADLPPHPRPPAGAEPRMQVEVPSARLTAQWNLGAWHLLRHCAKNPMNGRLWFNDYPYGILGAETYLILAALDLTGAHQAAEDGFDQWLSLPMDPDSKGHHPWALPDRPNGLFSEGHGCLTHAVGPPGGGGHMDGVHAFGPGSIGWALTEHYWMTGDREWLEDVRAADQGQRRLDAASTAPAGEHRPRRRTSLVQGPAAGAAGDPGQRRFVDAVLRVRGLLLGLCLAFCRHAERNRS